MSENTPEQRIESATELFEALKALAASKGYNIYKMPWLNSLKSFSTELKRSQKNIENGGWEMMQIHGGPDNKKWKFTRNGKKL